MKPIKKVCRKCQKFSAGKIMPLVCYDLQIEMTDEGWDYKELTKVPEDCLYKLEHLVLGKINETK